MLPAWPCPRPSTGRRARSNRCARRVVGGRVAARQDFAEYSDAERLQARRVMRRLAHRREPASRRTRPACGAARHPTPPAPTCDAPCGPRCAPRAIRSSATGASPASARARWCWCAMCRARWSPMRGCCSPICRPAWPHAAAWRPSCSAPGSRASRPSCAGATPTAPSSEPHTRPRTGPGDAPRRGPRHAEPELAGARSRGRDRAAIDAGIAASPSSSSARWPRLSRCCHSPHRAQPLKAHPDYEPLTRGCGGAPPRRPLLAGNSLASLGDLPLP